ncbi:MAG TPA: hypothetical protein VL092_11285 [Chitinophagaceae bacterium]|nr:hypothetical protein [Chitinophagaceae bacterium]
MKRAEHIQTELNELGALVLNNLAPKMPYAVPKGYFSTLADEVSDLVHINEMTDPSLSWDKKTPFETPGPAYFEGFAANVLAKVQEAPELSRENPYTVPQGYFDSLPGIITAKAKAQANTPKRVPLFRTARLAASMAFIILAGLGVMKMNSTSSNRFSLNHVSQSEIDQYVTANLDDFDTDLIINGLASARTDKKIELSDAEIKAYLNETGWN